jgi:hypothetical protein
MKQLFLKFIFVIEIFISIIFFIFSLSVTFSNYLYPLPSNSTIWAKYFIPLVYFLVSLFFIYDIFNKITIKYKPKLYFKYNFQIIKIKNKKTLTKFSLYSILGLCSVVFIAFTALYFIGFIILISMFLDSYRYLKTQKNYQ